MTAERAGMNGSSELKVLLVEDNPGDAVLVRTALEDASLPLVQLVHVKTVHDAVARLDAVA